MPENMEFIPGKGTILKEGTDVTIIACGIMVAKALTAAKHLEEKNLSARVINMSSIKPIDKELIIESAKKTGAIITCEEHTIHGGLGGAVAEVVCQSHPVPMVMIGTNDTFGESGKADELLEKYGLTEEHIMEESIKLIERKS